MKKILNIKTFIILVISCALIVLVIGKCIEKNRYDALEDKKKATKDNPLRAYIDDKAYGFEDMMKCFKWEDETINSMTFGVNHTGDGISFYYIDDEELVQKVLKELKKIDFYSVAGDIPNIYNANDGKIWGCQLYNCSEDVKYAMYISSAKTTVDDTYIVNMGAAYEQSVGGGLSAPYPVFEPSDRGMMIINEDLSENFMKIYEEYVSKLTMEQIIEWNSKGDSILEEYFIYEHTPAESTTVIEEDNTPRYCNKYTFPIEGTDCYMELVKYNETICKPLEGEAAEEKFKEYSELYEKIYGGSYKEYLEQLKAGMQGNVNYVMSEDYTINDVVSVKIYNEAGDSIDVYSVDGDAIKEFVK